jgi:thiamine-phosphate diphosphorylase
MGTGAVSTLAARSRLAEQLAVYFVADPEQTERDVRKVVTDAVANGVTIVQLRAKVMPDDEFQALAVDLLAICHERSVPFIVNDRLAVALAIGADGVHLGEHDLPIDEARALAAPPFIIGASPTTVEQAAAARILGADYVGLGPVYATASKADAGAEIGLDGLSARIEAAKLPAVGIGGITVENATAVILAGADGVAVISAIQGAPDPGRAAGRLAAAVRAGLDRRI